ncbi:putative leucine-rich repeat domain superfamily [Helianthus annuus]|nr:putative leucine-rich repeat domain superfamily [Helianthus annuus]
MHGSLSLEFPKDFYENMQNLKVIAYYELQYPLFPRALANLKSLCLQDCKLMFDLTCIGDLENLEVLSLAHCGIHKLPSRIGNLKKLKLLDLTGCVDLHIDDGVFENLESLEELYMRVSEEKAVRFTNTNFEELKKLCALEVEFMEEMTQLKHLALTKLYKFKIAMGCMLKQDRYNERNTLKLVTDSITDLQDCKINELFNKIEKLYLQVGNMTSLQDVSIHHYDQRSFCNLTDLEVSNCVNLIYLFPMSVASGLRKLECLRVLSCSVLKALVQDDGREINSVGEMIKFEKLKFLSLQKLPKLASLFLVNNVVELPQLVELEVDGLPNFTSIYPDDNDTSALQQPFLNSQVRISMLNKLKVKSMDKLTQIRACSSEEEVNNISMLKEIEVERCDSLVHLFPTNPMRILNHLERLTVKKCGSIETIFSYDLEWVGHEVEQVGKSRLTSIEVIKCDRLVNIFPTNPMRILNHLERLTVEKCGSIETIFDYDLEWVGHEVEQVVKSSLRSIMVKDSEKVRELWRIKSGENNSSSIRGFEALERINIEGCKGFRNVFTTTNTKLDIRIVADISIYDCGERGKNKDLICLLLPSFPHKFS